jgi:hypothetical protein
VEGGPASASSGGGPGGPGPESPVFKAADTECHHFLAEVEKKGGGPKKLESAGPSSSVAK